MSKPPEEKPAYASIDEYIAQFPEHLREILYAIRNTIRQAAPQAKERMSWQMPTFWQNENLIHFAAAKNHIGLYPGESGVRAFAGKLTGYQTSKGAIRFPLSQPVPYDLIDEITRFRVAEVTGKMPGGAGKQAVGFAAVIKKVPDMAKGEETEKSSS